MPDNLTVTPQKVSADKAALVTADIPLAQLATGGRVPVKSRRMDQPLFDTLRVDPALAGQRLRFFADFNTNTVPAVAKSRVDTNIPAEGELPSPQTFAILGLGIQVGLDSDGVPPTIADLKALRAYSWIQYVQGQKPIWFMPTEKLPGPGVVSAIDPAVVGAGGFVNIGSPVPMDIHRLGFVLSIPTGYPYGVELRTSPGFSASSDYWVRLWLYGIMSRSMR